MPFGEKRGAVYRKVLNLCTPVLMNMCNITFQVLRLSTFVFNKCSKKNIHDYTCICGYERKGFWLKYCWPCVVDGGPASHQHWANVLCYLVFLAPEWKTSTAYYNGQ